MNQPLLSRRSPLWMSNSLLILTAFFFLMPWAFKAARQSLSKNENNVKDWLPADFNETAELEWFADHFVGESFVVATWPGCSSGDQRLKLLEQKLRYESAAYDPATDAPESLKETYRRARQVGQELQLLQTGDDYRNWGGQDERWLCTPDQQWYYITPDGRLYRWNGSFGGVPAVVRSVKRAWFGPGLEGQFVVAFGDPAVEESPNPFHNDLSLLCAPLFATVQTGDSIVAELTSEGGPLWPVDLTDVDRREIVARRRALARLTGVLFAPAVPPDFAWTPAAFRDLVPADRRDQLPGEFDEVVQLRVDQIVGDRFADSLSELKSASIAAQTDAWYEVFDTVGVEPPPRATCVLVTLTEVAKNNLEFALGRGLMGGPRGRLLQLAEQSGVAAAPAPSMAPPPFDSAPALAVGLPPLRMGGPPVDNQAIDEEGTITLVRLVGYSVLLGIVLSYFCFRSVKVTVMVFIVGGSAAMLSMAMVWWTDGTVDAVLMSMPSLVYVLGLSGAIHVINYYRDEVRIRGQVGAAGRALRHAFLPCTLASLTTAIGLGSLVTSNLAPISNFGLYSAIGVIATLGILFSYLPAALETFAPVLGRTSRQRELASNDGDQPAPRQPSDQDHENRLADLWAAAGRWITAKHAPVSAACLLLVVVAAFGLLHIKTSVQLLKLFDSSSRVIEDYAWLERNFGKLVPMELVLRVPEPYQAENVPEDQRLATPALNMLQRAEAVARISTVVERALGEHGRDVVGQTVSADTFMKPLPKPSNGYSSVRAIYNDDLNQSRDQLLDSDYVRIEQQGPFVGAELWRISLRVGALSDVDYGRFISTLRTAVEPVLRAYDTRDALLAKLQADVDGHPVKLSGKDFVLVLGCPRPPDLQHVDLISPTDQQIQTDSIYRSTLGELLAGERIKTPAWFDPATAEKLQLGGPQWNQFVQRFDAIIWLGGQGVTEEHLAGAKQLIDARQIVDRQIRPSLTDQRIPVTEGAENLQVIYTGVVPVVYKAQRTLLQSLANSIGLAFVLIALVMIVLLNPGRTPVAFMQPRNLLDAFAAGAVSMIPNLFPVLLVFGVMCHAGMEIDIGTMMTASVAMGVAVDDTIHFLSWFRAHIDRGMNRIEAVIETYRRVGPAMTQTTIVGGLGLFVFAFSTFTPTQRFGTLMLVMLAAALVGDLVLLPALLAGPCGRFFKPRIGPQADPPNDPPNDASTPGNRPSESPIEFADDGQPGDELGSEGQEQEEAFPRLRVHYPSGRPSVRRTK